ncbi:hypothetical protein H9650_16690 [Psychrobacillus sp. Sa2BUA9]|uniref:Uncharacterized protein n=1 Tax=Psychrobacillus faecigallinarum TaxID=2762235 RepID=A0ABR8RDB1_9BACI|nr:hypothetical protein [Psychrobacillus faecigallinarum]MBD7945748.1 hypothetical protein [Psychrobacillus faecigallinarum]
MKKINKPTNFNEETCLALAIKLLIKIGELKMYEAVIQRFISEGNYENLYKLLLRCQHKERYKKLLENPYWRMPKNFDAKKCLAQTLSYLLEVGELEHNETVNIITNESYPGVYKLLNRQIQRRI